MRKLNFKDYWDTVGTSNMAHVLKLSAVKMKYAHQIRCGAKIPGEDLCLRVIAAAAKVTPGFAPDLGLMRRGVEPTGRRSLKIQPSAAFVRASRRKKVVE